MNWVSYLETAEDKKAKTKERKRLYYLKNKERIRKQQQEYQRNNRDRNARLQRGFRQRHPDKNPAYARLRRALMRGNKVEKYSIEKVLEMYGTDCHLCGKPIDLKAPRFQGRPGWRHGLQIDHIVPISKGGSDTIDNVRPVHGFCNLSKGNGRWGNE
jgi:5-methylcytosine-specific restriction endonuclease McrA